MPSPGPTAENRSQEGSIYVCSLAEPSVHAGLDLARRQVTVAHDPPAAGRVRQMPLRLDELRHLGLNRLHQQSARPGTRKLRQ